MAESMGIYFIPERETALCVSDRPPAEGGRRRGLPVGSRAAHARRTASVQSPEAQRTGDLDGRQVPAAIAIWRLDLSHLLPNVSRPPEI